MPQVAPRQKEESSKKKKNQTMFGLNSLWSIFSPLFSLQIPAVVLVLPWVLSRLYPELHTLLKEALETQSNYLTTCVAAVAGSAFWFAKGRVTYAKAHQAKFRHQNETEHFCFSGKRKEWIEELLGRVPNWVAFPEYEKVHWLNEAMAKKMWPHLGQIICDKIASALEEKLAGNLPMAIKAVKIIEASPGDLAPVFTGVKFLHTPKDNEILLELGLTYSGNPTLVFNILTRATPFALKIKLNNFHISCPLRVGLHPLLSTYPLVGSLHLSFFGKPKMDFSLSIVQQSLDLMAIPGLSSTIKTVMYDSIHACMVWPNVLEIPLRHNPTLHDKQTGMKKSLSMAELDAQFGIQFTPVTTVKTQDEATGILSVLLMQALNLPSGPDLLDRDPSPYAVLKMSGRRDVPMQSSVASSTINPVWEETFDILCYSLYDELNVEIYDGNSWNNMKVPSALNPVAYGRALASAPGTFATFLTSSSDERKQRQVAEHDKENYFTELNKDKDKFGQCLGQAAIKLSQLKPWQETKILANFSRTDGKIALKLKWCPFSN